MIILKYPLALMQGPQAVDMPVGAEVVHVHEQHGVPIMWARTHESASITRRQFAVFATGEHIGRDWRYLGTAHIGDYVWHVCEQR